MHVDGISILFSSFFILPSAFPVDLMINLAIFFKLFYVILFIIFYESRLPQNLYHVTKFSQSSLPCRRAGMRDEPPRTSAWEATQIVVRGTQPEFSENICSEDDLRSRIFGTFCVKFLACLPLLGFSNILKMV